MRKKMFDFEPLVNMKFHERLQCVIMSLMTIIKERGRASGLASRALELTGRGSETAKRT